MNAQKLVEHYALEPHPEGGFFRESYRAELAVDAPGFEGSRNVATAIYFLLPQGAQSSLHRIGSDEIWHFYRGGPMALIEIDADGNVTETILGPDIEAGHVLQHVVPAGVWFGGYPLEETAYSFVGCTVAPGFDFADFELAERAALLRDYPHHAAVIERLT